jgi:hypothetical protein
MIDWREVRAWTKRFVPERKTSYLHEFVPGRKGPTAVNQLSLIDFTKRVNAAAGPAS